MPARIDTAPLRRLGRDLLKLAGDSPKQLRQATASVRRIAATEAKRNIRESYNIKVAGVKGGLDVRSGDLVVTLDADNKPVSASQFAGTRQVKRGLRLQVLKGGQATVIRRGFVAKNKRVPFIREGDSRLPIRKATGPSVADMLANAGVRKKLVQTLGDRAVKELERRLLRLRAA